MSLIAVAAAVATAAAQHAPQQVAGTPVTTVIKDMATVVALFAGGLFTYFKFIKGRVLGPRASLTLRAHLLAESVPKRRFPRLPSKRPPPGGAIGIELCIQNRGQIQLWLTTDTELLLTISSITESHAFTATDLTQGDESFKHEDAYFAKANLILDEGARPEVNVTIEPGEEARFTALFPVPAGHAAAAYHVVVNCHISYRSWFTPSQRWWDSRMLVLPETSDSRTTSTEVS